MVGKGRSRSIATAAAAGFALLGVASAVAAIPVHRFIAARTTVPVHLAASEVVLAVAAPMVAAVLLAHQRGNRVGWLLLSTALLGPYLLLGQYGAVPLTGHIVPAAGFAVWVSVWGYFPYLIVWGLVPLHFPDGGLPGRRWRVARDITVALIVVQTIARMVAPIASDTSPALQNPVGLSSAPWLNVITLVASFAVVLGSGIVGVAAVWTRLRSSSGVERAQLQWLVFGATCLVGSAFVGVALGGAATDVALSIGMVALVMAIAMGAIRHRLFDIGTALSRTVVYVVLSGLLVVAYAAVMAGLGNVVVGPRIALAVVAVAALAMAAARDQLQRLVDRMLFGARRDPLTVLRQVRGGMELAAGPVDALGQMADGLRAALKLPYVAVLAHDGRLIRIAAGTVVPDAERLVVRDRGEQVGTLVVGHRHPGERFNRSESAVLSDVAQRCGVLIAAAVLQHDLARSREDLVRAREEERRRLRRDLHDSIGPELAGMAIKADSLADRLDGPDADRAASLSRQLRETVRAVRHVVDDLRPPAVDDLGLIGALSQLIAPFAPSVVLDAPANLPPLPAASEVAAYRIVAEAVTNAVRHSGCSRCVVRLENWTPWLLVEIIDDGCGIPADTAPGVGLLSISERASEVGGRIEVGNGCSGSGPDDPARAARIGTAVRARLPLTDT